MLAAQPSPIGSGRLPDEHVHIIRWTARIWSGLMVVLFWTLLLRVGAPFVEDAGSWQQQVQVALLVIVTIGVALAWRWEIVGATVVILSAAALGVLAALSYSPGVAFLPFAAFLVPSVLYWLAWQRTQPAYAIAVLAIFVTAVSSIGAYAANEVHDTYFGPTHPSSATRLLPTPAIQWIWAGGTTETSTIVKARLSISTESLRLAVSADEALSDARYTVPASVTPSNVATFEVGGLEPDRRYFYALEIEGEIDGTRPGEFHTFPAGPASFGFAFGACARTGSNGAVFDTVRIADPLFLLYAGDFHYADIVENDPDDFRAAFDAQLESPPQALLYRSTSIAYMWDDHDYGPNDGDRTSPSREAALKVYDEYIPHYPLPATGDAPVYQAFTVGRVRFIVTDLRSARDPAELPIGPEKSMMGAEQKAWFKDELLDARDRYPLTVWLSTVPWIADEDADADHWGGYAYERREIANFIAENDIDNLLMLAGDAHMLAIDDGSNNNYATTGDASFPVFHAAAFDRYGTVKGGPYSEGVFPGGGHFGVVEVEDGGDELTVNLSGRNWEGAEIVGYSFTVPAEYTSGS